MGQRNWLKTSEYIHPVYIEKRCAQAQAQCVKKNGDLCRYIHINKCSAYLFGSDMAHMIDIFGKNSNTNYIYNNMMDLDIVYNICIHIHMHVC